VKVLLESPKFLELIKNVIEEIREVAKAEGVDLPQDTAKEMIQLTRQLGDYHTSMWEDYRHGKPSELKYFNGKVIERGEAHNIDVPYNRAVRAITDLCFHKRTPL